MELSEFDSTEPTPCRLPWLNKTINSLRLLSPPRGRLPGTKSNFPDIFGEVVGDEMRGDDLGFYGDTV